jgi:hypothetical protein
MNISVRLANKGSIMFRDQVIEPFGFILAAAVALFSLILFYSDNQEFLGSFYAALMASGLTWVTYIILRWVLLAFRK